MAIKNPQNAFLKEAHKRKQNGKSYNEYGFLEEMAEELKKEQLITQGIIYINEKGKAAHLGYFMPFYVNPQGETSKNIEDVYSNKTLAQSAKIL